jgi:hypothetical protein
VFRANWDDDQPTPVGPVIVFSHGCEIDKAHDTVLVASVVSQAQTPADQWGHIITGKVAHGLWLEDCAEPGWVNLRTLRPFPKAPLQQHLDRRLHSMTPEGRVYLAGGLFAFLTRIRVSAAVIADLEQQTAAQAQN